MWVNDDRIFILGWTVSFSNKTFPLNHEKAWRCYAVNIKISLFLPTFSNWSFAMITYGTTQVCLCVVLSDYILETWSLAWAYAQINSILNAVSSIKWWDSVTSLFLLAERKRERNSNYLIIQWKAMLKTNLAANRVAAINVQPGDRCLYSQHPKLFELVLSVLPSSIH